MAFKKFMIIGIHHIAISVPDIDAGLAFYRDVLGFEQVRRSSISGNVPAVEAAIGIKAPVAQVAMLRGGNAYIELWAYEHPKPRDKRADPPDFGYPHFALEVKNIKQEYKRLKDAGMDFVGEPVNFGKTSAIYGRDPFGNIIELSEVKAADSTSLANAPLINTKIPEA